MLSACARKLWYHVLRTESAVSDEERLEGLVKNKLSSLKYPWKLLSRKERAKGVLDH